MKKVKCIDNRGCFFVTSNREYEVVRDRDDYYDIRADDNKVHSYDKIRFSEIIPQQQEVEYYEVIKEVPLKYKIGDKIYPGGNTGTSSDFYKAASYCEYFKPIYKQQFKAGDIVYAETASSVAIFEIAEGKFEHAYGSKWSWQKFNNERPIQAGPCENYCSKKDVRRLATKEEIERASAITIGGYKMEITTDSNYSGGTVVKFGCSYYSREIVINARILILSGLTLSYKGEEITIDKLDKILDKLK